MTQYISKDALVAEIDERIKAWKEYYDDMHNAECHELASGAYLRIDELKDFKRFIDALEVKEVDLEKEIDEWCNKCISEYELEGWVGMAIQNVAKHFFELGLNAKQG